MSRSRLCFVVVTALGWAAFAAPARADTERFAVVIGNNAGAADEQQLRYAESDAQRIADVLSDLGGVPSENQVVLRGKTSDEVRSAIIAMNERIRVGVRSLADSVLFVYYSGHGDADALHLGSSRLPLQELEMLVRGSPAGVRLLIIDSCRSGSITRVKGGHPAPPLALAIAAPLFGEGTIVLTASTLTEDAQESDQLSGSFFTHYLLSGLRGAADDNGDHIITVAEVFDYTRAQTIMASSRTLAGTQHPTFRYDMRGRADLPLTELGNTVNHGQLILPPGATWLVIRTGTPPIVVGEIAADARSRTLSLRAGTYAVRGRTQDALLEGEATIVSGHDTTLDASRLSRTRYAALVRKGKGEILSSVSGPVAGYAAQFAYESLYARNVFGGLVGWIWVLPEITISPRLSITRNSVRSLLERGMLGDRPDLITADLRIARSLEVGPVAMDVGFTVGAGRWHGHDFVGDKKLATGLLGVTIGASVPLWGRSYLAVELAEQIYAMAHSAGASPFTMHTFHLMGGIWL